MRTKTYFVRVIVRWAIITAALAGLLFALAGTTQLVTLRAYLAAFSAVLLVTMLAVHPDLAEERFHPGEGALDPGVRFAISFFFLLTVAAAALDVGRLHDSDSVPGGLSATALLLFIASTSFQAWAMTVNPFFSPVIRLQKERGHHVISRGPYRFLRHPGYLAMLVAMPASALAIGSWLALIPAAGFGVVIVRRGRIEDEFLRRDLTGYTEYANNVRARLFPCLAPLRLSLVLVGVALLVAALLYALTMNSTADLQLPVSAFNEQHAFEDLKRLASLGPRPPASEGHDKASLYIDAALLEAGVELANLHHDPFEALTPLGQIHMDNIIAAIPGERADVVIVAAHYDTKRTDRARFIGANDGASGVAFLLEMARLLAQRRNPVSYWLVFFDGEEPLKEWSYSDSLYGSRHLAEKLTADGSIHHLRAFILVDMIADQNLDIRPDSNSTPELTRLVFSQATKLGYRRFFTDRPSAISDDHLPFIEAGVPAVDIIDLDYGPFNLYWHTRLDTVGHCNAASLGIVGRVVLAAIEELENKFEPHRPA